MACLGAGILLPMRDSRGETLCLAVFALTCTGGLRAQTGCPALAFDSAHVISQSVRGRDVGAVPNSLVLRQGDGSYSEFRYPEVSHLQMGTRRLVQTAANLISQGANCEGAIRRSAGTVASDVAIRPRPHLRRFGVLPLGAGGSKLTLVGIEGHSGSEGAIFDAISPDRQSVSRSLGIRAPNARRFLPVDFSGDGILDLILFGDGSQPDLTSVAFYQGGADGSFTKTSNHELRGELSSVAALRINNDSMLDLSVYTQTTEIIDGLTFPMTPRIHTLLNLGSGRFEVQSSGRDTFHCLAAAVADFDGDGLEDIACATATAQIRFSKRIPNGFLPAGDIVLSGVVADTLVAVDLNQDAKMDLVAGSSGAVYVLLGNGSGSFTLGPSYAISVGDRSLIVEDFDRDGRLDVVVGHGEPNALLFVANSSLEVLYGLGDGRLVGTPSHAFPQPDNRYPPWADFLAGSPKTYLTLHTTGYLTAVEHSGSGAPTVRFREQIFPVWGPYLKVAQADADGDGLKDLIVVQLWSGVYVSRNLGNARFAAATKVFSCQSCLDAAFDDFNRDGKMDIALGINSTPGDGAKSFVTLLWNEGRGTFRASPEIAVGMDFSKVASGDLNGDGLPDLVFALNSLFRATDLPVSILPSTTPGVFGAPLRVTVGMPLSNFAMHAIRKITVTDLNADGRNELAVQLGYNISTEPATRLLAYSLEQNRQLRLRGNLSVPYWLQDNSLSDIDRDGIPDLLVSSTGWQFAKGRGDFTVSPFQPVLGLAPSEHFQIGDVDGDGRLDLLVTNMAVDNRVANLSVALNRTPRRSSAVSSASFSVGPIAQGSLFSIFGARFTSFTTANISSTPPTELGGVSVTVRDARGRETRAPMLFVSEGQVNAIMPADAASGPASLRVQTWFGSTEQIDIEIVDFRPGLFASGSAGLAAANLLRVRQDGSRSVEGIVRLDAQGNLVAAPIAFGGSGEQLFLLLYGSGIRGRSGTPETKVWILGKSYTPIYAGAQGEFPGLDQVNVALDPSLSGAGLVDLQISQTLGQELRSNGVKIAFQ